MLSCKQIFELLPPIEQQLENHHNYLAHLPNKTDSTKTDELLFQHCHLVNSYFVELIEVHGLDKIIDSLTFSLCDSLKIKDKVRASLFIKGLFFNTITFHDYGKINEDFQVLRMKNPKFKKNNQSFFTPSHGHSWLGAYIFTSQFLEKVILEKFDDADDECALFAITTCFSYSILMHHSSSLGNVFEKIKDSNFGEFYKEMKPYLSKYGFEFNEEISDFVLKDDFDTLSKSLQKSIAFPLYALIKLNFSLLTASDYLATHEYMSSSENGKEGETTDFGVFKDRNRILQICENLRTTQSHNLKTFSELHTWETIDATKELQGISKENLNKLRQQMAVELITTIRQNTDKRLFYIEAPTGGGKTNLSMITLAELLENNPELNKVFYVFPFTTLITQTLKSLKETLLLTENELVEIHSKAGFHSKNEEKEDGEYGERKSDYIDNLFALFPVTLLSHVKFFDILKTNRKETNYLLHRMANSVVIIDEIQTYNPKIWDKMLYFIGQYSTYFNIRFILMSATLPKIDELNKQMQLNEIPEFTNLLPNAQSYLSNPNFADRVMFKFEEELFESSNLTPEILWECVKKKSEEYESKNGSVHTIIEFIFKKSASNFRQIVLNSKQNLFEEANILVLSGTILEPRRREIINFIKNEDNRFKNILLITTQVVEAGVDIDMDLGFKNTSLLDSDEQLAGRVNRNASKDTCEVYLFKLDNASFIYGEDERFKVVQNNQIKTDEIVDILNKKEFHRLYKEVFVKINGYNEKAYADNFSGEILDNINRLDFKEIDRNFKIIDQENESVFVPILLPIIIESSKTGKSEVIFSEADLGFLGSFGVETNNGYLNGKDVWEVYSSLIDREIKNKKAKNGFDIKSKIDFKILQSIMSKFTFSLFAHSKVVKALREYSLIGRNNEHTVYGFIYLESFSLIYEYEGGLIDSKFNASENQFL